jgi:hypothetical protein
VAVLRSWQRFIIHPPEHPDQAIARRGEADDDDVKLVSRETPQVVRGLTVQLLYEILPGFLAKERHEPGDVNGLRFRMSFTDERNWVYVMGKGSSELIMCGLHGSPEWLAVTVPELASRLGSADDVTRIHEFISDVIGNKREYGYLGLSEFAMTYSGNTVPAITIVGSVEAAWPRVDNDDGGVEEHE